MDEGKVKIKIDYIQGNYQAFCGKFLGEIEDRVSYSPTFGNLTDEIYKKMKMINSYCAHSDILPQFNLEIKKNAEENLQESQRATLTQMCFDRNEVIRLGSKLTEISKILD